MKRAARPLLFAIALSLAACGSEPAPAPANDQVESEAAEAASAAAAPALPDCPFHQTGDWAGSVEGGRLLVTGTVDLQMAGFRPVLTPREGAGAAFDLALVPEPQAAVTNEVRYEGAPASGAGEIWCGGEKIADFDIVRVG
jgi:hypothetical protein